MPKVQKKNFQKNECYVYSLRWTVENTVDNRDIFEKAMRRFCKKWIYQAEVGKETKRAHFQGYCSTKKKTKNHILASTLNILGMRGIDVRAAVGDSESAAQVAISHYVMKQDTRVAGPWKDCPDEYDGQDLWPEHMMPNWQRYITTLYKRPLDVFGPEARHINWLYDPPGSKGKSRFLKFLDFKYGIPKCDAGKCSDILCFIREVQGRDGYTFNLTRTIGRETCLSELYQAIESIQDGHFFVGKYNSSRVLMKIPRVWVFANRYPDTRAVTGDRWIIWIFDPNDERGIRPMTQGEREMKEEELAREREERAKLSADRRFNAFANFARIP